MLTFIKSKEVFIIGSNEIQLATRISKTDVTYYVQILNIILSILSYTKKVSKIFKHLSKFR